ncbi:hypothetical protein QYM36_019871, partial [Artemia franciscana]
RISCATSLKLEIVLVKMGKAVKKRSHIRHDGITGNPELYEETSDESFSAVQDSVIQSIFDQLQSPKTEDRDCGANALATLPQGKNDALMLIKSGIVKACAPLLLDKNAAVRHSATGALRNLSTVGGEDACKLMVGEDVLTPLLAFLKKFSKVWTHAKTEHSAAENKSEKVDSSNEQFVEAVTLLWNLCESSTLAVSICDQEDVIDVLKCFLDVEKYGKSSVIAVGNLLLTLSEDNEHAVEKLKSVDTGIMNILSMNISGEASLNPRDLLIRILAAGITHNLCNGDLSLLPDNVQALVGESIKLALHENVFDSMSVLLNLIEGNSLEGMEEEADRDKHIDSVFESIDFHLSAQSSALILLANLCCSNGSEDWEDVTSEDESEVVNGKDESMPKTIAEDICALPGAILGVFRQDSSSGSHVLQLVLNKTIPIPENLIRTNNGKYAKRWKSLVLRIKSLRCDAFFCLGNLVPLLSVQDFGGVDNLFQAWCDLNQMLFQTNEASTQSDLAEAAVNTVRSITEKLKEVSPKSFEKLSEQDVRILCTAVFSCPDPSIVACMVRILSCVGVSVAGSPNEPLTENRGNIIKMIGSCLLQVITTDGQLWIVAEALDAIYDIFAEDHVDTVGNEIALLQVLKSVVEPLKQKGGCIEPILIQWHQEEAHTVCGWNTGDNENQ